MQDHTTHLHYLFDISTMSHFRCGLCTRRHVHNFAIVLHGNCCFLNSSSLLWRACNNKSSVRCNLETRACGSPRGETMPAPCHDFYTRHALRARLAKAIAPDHLNSDTKLLCTDMKRSLIDLLIVPAYIAYMCRVGTLRNIYITGWHLPLYVIYTIRLL